MSINTRLWALALVLCLSQAMAETNSTSLEIELELSANVETKFDGEFRDYLHKFFLIEDE